MAVSALLDTLKFTQRLEAAGVNRDQAVAHAELARDMVVAGSATSGDLDSLRSDVAGIRRTDLPNLRREIESSLRELDLRTTIKLGAIIVAAVAIVATLQKLL